MKVLTIGNGFIAGHLPYPIVPDRLRPNHKSVEDFLELHKPDILINCIGYCGVPNIDACEINRQKTLYLNTVLPIILAMGCDKRDIRFINIASGCVFSGPSPHSKFIKLGVPEEDSGWLESDPATPPSTYSRSKYSCDLVLEALKNTTSLRIRMPISPKNSSRNLLSKLIGYKQVVEIPNSVTYVSELSRSIQFVIKHDLTGTFHITSPRPITHSEILTEYQKHVPEHQFTSINSKELNDLVAAPRSNCILDNSKIVKAGFSFMDQDELLKNCVREFVENRKKENE